MTEWTELKTLQVKDYDNLKEKVIRAAKDFAFSPTPHHKQILKDSIKAICSWELHHGSSCNSIPIDLDSYDTWDKQDLNSELRGYFLSEVSRNVLKEGTFFGSKVPLSEVTNQDITKGSS